MINWICAYCGKNTSDVDYDYLVGTNHLVCVMQSDNKKIEIHNWNKLTGNEFDVMGASFFIHNTSDVSNVYTAWVHPLDSGEPFTRVTLFSDSMDMQVKVLPPAKYNSNMTPYDLTSTITKHHISNPSIFIQTIAEALLSDTITRDILSYVSREQDSVRFKSGGASSSSGLSGSSGNNLW